MKTLAELLPLAAALVVAGVVTWLLLDRNVAVGRWVLAALLFGHGWVHVMFLVPHPEPAAAASGGGEWPFDMAKSWLVSGAGVDLGLVRTVGMALIAVTVVGFALAALATVGVLVPAGWWSGLVIGSAFASFVLLGLFFAPQLLLGFGIDLALLWLVVGSLWSPTAAAIPRAGIG